VDVHIDLARVQLQQNHGDRVTTDRQEGVVGLSHGVGQRAILNPAPVDKEGNEPTVGAVE
jgi:hypothetical protein